MKNLISYIRLLTMKPTWSDKYCFWNIDKALQADRQSFVGARMMLCFEFLNPSTITLSS